MDNNFNGVTMTIEGKNNRINFTQIQDPKGGIRTYGKKLGRLLSIFGAAVKDGERYVSKASLHRFIKTNNIQLPDYIKSPSLLSKAQEVKTCMTYIGALGGSAEAQCRLAELYMSGEGIMADKKQNAAEGFKWYEKAAEQGLTEAQHELGMCYAAGAGVKKDKQEALTWFEKAANNNHIYSQYVVGRYYQKGKWTEQNPKKAFESFKKAAENDFPSGQYELGLCYKNGEGTVEDPKKAFEWFQKAADQELDDAQYELGLCYLEGRGVKKDNEEAKRYFKLASEQGHKLANNSLENMEEESATEE